jgi:hypothetical protein
MRVFRIVALTAALAVAATALPSAQIVSSVFKVTAVQGEVFVDDRPVSLPAPIEMKDPSVVRTADGRAAISIRGGTLYLDRNSSARVMGNAPYNFNKVEVLAGSAIVTAADAGGQVFCQDEVRLSQAGIFRIDVHPAASSIDTRCAFRVFEGAAAIQLVSVTSVLTPGQQMDLNKHCGDMIPSRTFDVLARDDFDRWARVR